MLVASSPPATFQVWTSARFKDSQNSSVAREISSRCHKPEPTVGAVHLATSKPTHRNAAHGFGNRISFPARDRRENENPRLPPLKTPRDLSFLLHLKRTLFYYRIVGRPLTWGAAQGLGGAIGENFSLADDLHRFTSPTAGHLFYHSSAMILFIRTSLDSDNGRATRGEHTQTHSARTSRLAMQPATTVVPLLPPRPTIITLDKEVSMHV